MNEQRFIRKNKGKWQEFEQALQPRSLPEPDRLSELHLHLIDDLSYARTHFPESRLVKYLNQLAVRAHHQIYRTRRERTNRLISFFTVEVPMAFVAHRRYLVYATVVFGISILIGMISSILEPDFVRSILSDTYVNITLENIDQGDPFAVYSAMSSDAMFTQIAINNVRITFFMYVLGIFAGIPTVLILLNNGVMVGAFIQLFINKGLGWVAFSTVFLHGAMELSAIVVAGSCGLLLGRSVLFPGTLPRRYALVQGAKMSLKVVIGVVPFIVAAALIESYVTRMYQDLSGSARILIILGTFAVMFWYVVIYPLKFKAHV